MWREREGKGEREGGRFERGGGENSATVWHQITCLGSMTIYTSNGIVS